MKESDKTINRNTLVIGTVLNALKSTLSDSQKETYNEEIENSIKKMGFDSELQNLLRKHKV